MNCRCSYSARVGTGILGVALAWVASPCGAADAATDEGGLQEIVVTATRREENINKVPISITALTAEQMDQKDIKSIDDIARDVPGIAFFRGAYGSATISIRGVGDNSSSGGVGIGTTGIYIDDTPITPRSAPLSFTETNPYPSTFDMQRVEVLRGPQGTLFGAGSMGGAIRFITTPPSLTDTSFYVHGEGSYTDYGAPSYEGGFAGGMPVVSDVLGVRVSFDDRRDGGWINRIQRSDLQVLDANANWTETQTGRIAATYAPLENLKITASYYAQSTFRDDEGLYWEGFSDPDTGHFNSAGAPQPDRDRINLGAIKVEWSTDQISLTSNTSYLYRRNKNQYDVTTNALELTPAGEFPLLLNTQLPGLKDFTAIAFDLNQQNSFVQEIRVQSNNPSDRITWQGGIFFQRQRSISQDYQFTSAADLNQIAEDLAGVNYLTLFFGIGLIPPNISYHSIEDTLDQQTALFGEVNFKITDQWNATAGVRVSHFSSESTELVGGPESYISTQLTGSTDSISENPVTPKFVLSYQADPNNLLYASVSKGFRPGGPVHNLAPSCDQSLRDYGYNSAPTSYSPDKLWSYELGAKDQVLDHRLSLSTSVYDIDWKGIQQATYLISCGQALPFNGGAVTVRGFDFQIDARPIPSLRLAATIAYTHAIYTESLLGEASPTTGIRPVVINEGDSIGFPAANTPAPWTANATPEYDFTAWNVPSYLLANYTFSSHHYIAGASQDPTTVQYLASELPTPVIQQLDLRTGVTIGPWQAALFAKNVFNSHPQTRTSYQYAVSNWYLDSTLQPLTVGLSFTYRSK